jgi:Na+-transporting NADH:ubiquinone oxidoreductase subunit NqrB
LKGAVADGSYLLTHVLHILVTFSFLIYKKYIYFSLHVIIVNILRLKNQKYPFKTKKKKLTSSVKGYLDCTTNMKF